MTPVATAIFKPYTLPGPERIVSISPGAGHNLMVASLVFDVILLVLEISVLISTRKIMKDNHNSDGYQSVPTDLNDDGSADLDADTDELI